jgi:hypothetical protein
MRTKELVKFVATDEVRRLAKKANDIQDASNPRGVHNFLGEVMAHFSNTGNGQKHSGSDMCCQNPISIAVLNKLNHLSGLDQTRTDCFSAIMDLADGRDVDWEVAFLK